MSEKDLIPLNKRTKEEARVIQVKGGLVKSEKKTIANTIKNLKTGRYAKKFSIYVQDLARNPETSAFKIFFLIEQLEQDWDKLNPILKANLVRLYIEAYRAIHPQKSININVNSAIKEDLERWFKEDERDKQS